MLLAKYPTLFMYSLGAAARLEYFEYQNKRKPDASEARQLLMLSKTGVESWGTEGGDCVFDSTPAILGGTISKRGRPRKGETALDASARRDNRRAAQSCSPHQLEELKVGELRKLLKESGGTPGSKRKSQLISELRTLAYFDQGQDSEPFESQMSNDAQPLLSYRQWLSIKLSTSYPQFLECNDDASRKSLVTDGE